MLVRPETLEVRHRQEREAIDLIARVLDGYRQARKDRPEEAEALLDKLADVFVDRLGVPRWKAKDIVQRAKEDMAPEDDSPLAPLDAVAKFERHLTDTSDMTDAEAQAIARTCARRVYDDEVVPVLQTAAKVREQDD